MSIPFKMRPLGGFRLPKGFTELEWLESPSTTEINLAAYFVLPISARNGVDSLQVVSEHFVPSGQKTVQMEGVGVNGGTFSTFAYSANSQKFFMSFDGVIKEGNSGIGDINCFFDCPQGEWVVYDSRRTPEGLSMRLNGELVIDYPVESWAAFTISSLGCFGRVSGEGSYNPYGLAGRKKWWKVFINAELMYDLIPVLDAEGTPCMFDRVSKSCFYNQGVGTFGYRVRSTGEEVAPANLTVLEYLEASGTQYIDTGVLPDARLRIELTGATLTKKMMCFIGAHSGSGYNTRVQIFSDQEPHVKTYRANTRNCTLNIPADEMTTSVMDLSRGLVTDSGSMAELPVSGDMPTVPFYLFACNRDAAMESQYNLVGRIRRCRIFRDGEEEPIADFVPVLDVSGIPCMYDNMSGSYHPNVGSGTFGYRVLHQETEFAPMSLRDPYYTAPSGVYARLSGENELEVLADTEETTGDGWEWFATTAEAYEHFGIVPDMEEELLTE